MQDDPFLPPMSYDEKCVDNSELFTLYQNHFTDQSGKYLSVILPENDQNHLDVQISPRIRLKLTYLKDEIKGLSLTTYENRKQKGYITLSSFTLGHITEFLEIIKILDISQVTERKISFSLEQNNQCKESINSLIKKTLNKDEKSRLVSDFLNNGVITDQDIVNTGYRKLSLQKFEKLLNNNNYLNTYKNENDIQNSSPEKVWQHFFKNNPWIFGYGLDYRFQSILQDEANLNAANLGGKNAVNADFLLGDNKFTTFVEIKRPDTKLFGEKKNRSNSWKLSTDLYEAHSQILEHKASGQIKLSESSREYDGSGDEIKQKAYDSKTILIIGTWKEVELGNAQEIKIKEKTFELFRHNSKNVEIITFDELYERAKYIAES